MTVTADPVPVDMQVRREVDHAPQTVHQALLACLDGLDGTLVDATQMIWTYTHG